MTEPATQLQSPQPSSNGPSPGLLQRLFRTKPPQALIDEAYQETRLMKKTLSAFDLIAFGIGATIGAGIFAMTGTAAAGQTLVSTSVLDTPIINFILNSPLGREGAGPAVIISFLLAAVACGLAALCYAELAAMIPVSGSAYTFAYAALGEVVAWTIGWDLILEYAVGNVAVAVSWSDYFLHVLHGISDGALKLPLWLTADATTAQAKLKLLESNPRLAELYSSVDLPSLFGHPVALNLPACAIVVVITWLLLLGIQESAKVNLAAVIIKVSVVIFFILYGAFFIKPENWVPFAPSGAAGIMGAAGIVFFSFIGFDAVSSTAEETKNPQRDMPIGMLGSLAICTVLYMGVSMVLTGILPYKTFAGDAAPVATALQSVGSSWAHALVSVGGLAGMTSVLLVYQLGQPRIFMAMARDGLLPAVFGKLHPKFRTPLWPTIATGVFVGLASMLVDIGWAAELTNIGTLAAFILVCGGVIVLRRTHPEFARPFKCPGAPLVPVLGIIACFALMLSLPVLTWLRFAGWMAVGAVIYAFYGFPKNALAGSANVSRG